MFTSFILCVVPENTHTLSTEANGNSEGMEIQKEAIYEGVRGGGAFRLLMIDELLMAVD